MTDDGLGRPPAAVDGAASETVNTRRDNMRLVQVNAGLHTLRLPSVG